ncbi:MAG: hypothetical protein V3V10_00900 [Planctomycetota bacterium]
MPEPHDCATNDLTEKLLAESIARTSHAIRNLRYLYGEDFYVVRTILMAQIELMESAKKAMQRTDTEG